MGKAEADDSGSYNDYWPLQRHEQSTVTYLGGNSETVTTSESSCRQYPSMSRLSRAELLSCHMQYRQQRWDLRAERLSVRRIDACVVACSRRKSDLVLLHLVKLSAGSSHPSAKTAEFRARALRSLNSFVPSSETSQGDSGVLPESRFSKTLFHTQIRQPWPPLTANNTHMKFSSQYIHPWSIVSIPPS